MDELISIVVPIYNSEKYLKKCVESIQNQTYKNIQIVLVDDGSTDSSPEICNRYAESDERVTVVHKENGGLQSAIGAGIDAARGIYIGFVDSDDWIEPDMYEVLHDNIANGDLASSGLIRHDISGKIIGKWIDLFEEGTYEESDDRFWENLIIYRDYPGGAVLGGIGDTRCTKLFRTKLARETYKDIDLGITNSEDFLFSVAYLLKCRKVNVSHRCFYHYVDNASSMCHKVNTHYLEEMSKWPRVTTLIEKHRMAGTLLDQFNRRYMFHLYSGISSFLPSSKLYGFPTYDWESRSELYGKKIVLFGAGKVGENLYRAWKTDDNIEIVGWIDNGYRERDDDITSPESIMNMTYDYVVCAVKNEKSANAMKEQLIDLGVPEDKVLWKLPIDIWGRYYLFCK